MPLRLDMSNLTPRKRLARLECTLEDVEEAIQNGVDISLPWEEFDMIDPQPSGGCVMPSYTPAHMRCWANYNTPLHKALENHHMDAAELIFTKGVSIDTRNIMGRTALYEAVEKRDFELADFLIAHGADVNATTEAASLRNLHHSQDRIQEPGLTALKYAIKLHDVEMIKKLLQAGADSHSASLEDWTAMDQAVFEDRADILLVLLQHTGQVTLSTRPSADDTESGELRDQARNFLGSNKMLPPSSCHAAYSRALEMTGYVDNKTEVPTDLGIDTESSASLDFCKRITRTLWDSLARLAEKPNPREVRRNGYCDTCVRYQQQYKSNSTSGFDHYGSRAALQASAKAGCLLCAILEDALTHKSGRWSGYSGAKPDHLSGDQIYLSTRVSYGLSISVVSGEQSATLEVKKLSGKHSCGVYSRGPLVTHDVLIWLQMT